MQTISHWKETMVHDYINKKLVDIFSSCGSGNDYLIILTIIHYFNY